MFLNSRVVSVLDLDYELPIHSFYTPALRKGAVKRLIRSYPEYAECIRQALLQRNAGHVWAVVLEKDNMPVLVLRNLACNVTRSTFRRVLRVDLNEHISPQACSNDWRQHEQADPLTSMTIVQ